MNEENSGGTLLSTYIHHPQRQIGTVLATSEGSTASSGTWNYYFQDAIGSTRSLWDEDGDRLGKYDYTPFGGKYGNTGEEITRKFTGHDWDTEARLYHTAYRQYSPDTGRWLTRDPLGMVDGPNVYAYVVNNPIVRFDAFGLCDGKTGNGEYIACMIGWVLASAAALGLAVKGISAFLKQIGSRYEVQTSVTAAFGACLGAIYQLIINELNMMGVGSLLEDFNPYGLVGNVGAVPNFSACSILVWLGVTLFGAHFACRNGWTYDQVESLLGIKRE